MKRFFIAKTEAPAHISEQLEMQSVKIEEMIQVTVPPNAIVKNEPITFFISKKDYNMLAEPAMEYSRNKAKHDKQTQTDESSFANNQH